MYLSPDTPLHVKQMQQKIWLSKTLEERLRLSAEMIDGARALQIHGIKMRHPDWTDEQVRVYRLRRLIQNDPSLAWLERALESPAKCERISTNRQITE